MTTRRTFLGGAAALATLSDPTRAASPTDHELVTRSGHTIHDYDVPAAGGSIYVERYDEDANVHLTTHVNDPNVCVTVDVSGEWGSAGLSLTPDQAEALATALRGAVEEWSE